MACQIFEEAARRQLHLALAELPAKFFNLEAAGMECDQETVTCLRSVLMKAEHLEWLPEIWRILDEATVKGLKTTTNGEPQPNRT